MSLAQLERDAALGRIGRTRRWMILTAAALTAAFAALVSAVVPGKSLGARASASSSGHVVAPRASRLAKMPPLASASQLGLQGPAQAPGSAAAPSDQNSIQAQQNQLAQQQAQQQQAQASAPAQSAAPAPAVVSGGS